MTAQTIRLADRIIADSENTRRDIERFFPGTADKIRVVYLAAHARFKPAEFEGQRPVWHEKLSAINEGQYFLYVGTLEPGKNLIRLITAFEKIADNHRDIGLVLAGDAGWMFQDILDRASQSPCADRIYVTGHLPDEQIVQLYQHALALVYPSLYEGFGMPPLEAMACGTPVITSNVASLPEVVGNAALLINPVDVSELAASMQRILEDDILREDLRVAGLSQAAKFIWTKTADETRAVYQEVVGS